MRAFVNGYEGRSISIKGGTDIVLNIKALNDDGSLYALSTATLTLEIYARADRRNAAVLSAAGVATVAADGSLTITLAATEIAIGVLPPGRYYAFLKLNLAGVITFGSKPTVLEVG